MTDEQPLAEINVGDDFVIYHREQHDAWIQSTDAINTELAR